MVLAKSHNFGLFRPLFAISGFFRPLFAVFRPLSGLFGPLFNFFRPLFGILGPYSAFLNNYLDFLGLYSVLSCLAFNFFVQLYIRLFYFWRNTTFGLLVNQPHYKRQEIIQFRIKKSQNSWQK